MHYSYISRRFTHLQGYDSLPNCGCVKVNTKIKHSIFKSLPPHHPIPLIAQKLDLCVFLLNIPKREQSDARKCKHLFLYPPCVTTVSNIIPYSVNFFIPLILTQCVITHTHLNVIFTENCCQTS